MRPGDAVTVEGPFGRAYLRPGSTRPLLLVAGGTGLAPMLSIARAALAERRERRVVLCAGATLEDDRYGEAELARLAARYPAFSFRIALTDLVEIAVGEILGMAPVVHAAGPPEMVSDLHRRLAAAGIVPADFHADAFTPVQWRPA